MMLALLLALAAIPGGSERRALPENGDDLLVEGIEVSVGFSYGARTVSFSWRPPRCDGPASVELPLAMWPTEAIGAGRGRVAVAGRLHGRTRIVLWDLELRHPVAPERPGGTQLAIARERVVLDEARADRHTAATLFRNPAPPDGVEVSLYVRFLEPGDVHRLDVLADGTSTLTKQVCARDDGCGLPVLPELAQPCFLRWSADHARNGFGFVLSASRFRGGCLEPSPLPTLVLLDPDRDGDLDEAHALGAEGWGARGWADGELYRPLF